jgi:hypothetical protein
VLTDNWLPAGKRAAVIWTIDDIFPGKTRDGYDGGGDLDEGALGRVHWLLDRHPELWVTLFTTPDWRETTPFPTRTVIKRIPVLRDRCYLTGLHPRGSMRLNRHPEFTAYLKNLPRTEIALHGLHHVHPGRKIVVEFQDQSTGKCREILAEGLRIFEEADLPFPNGMTPPGWNAPPALIEAMCDEGFKYLSSARDIFSEINPAATAHMSGLSGVSLIFPEVIANGRLVHLTANFQATSPQDRAFEILRAGGLLSIKSHIIKEAYGRVQLDGVDQLYMNYLDVLFDRIKAEFGEDIWWTTSAEVARTTLRTSQNKCEDSLG